jgi:hypothetical protein
MNLFTKGLLFVALSIMTTIVWAETTSKSNDVKDMVRSAHPRLTVEAEYDDNIFLEPSDEQDGFIFHAKPGFSVAIPFSGDQHMFSLSYEADLAAFTDFDDQNYNNHFVTGALDFNFPRFYVKTADNLRKTSLRADTEFTDRIDRFENLYSIYAGTKELNRLSFETGYQLFSAFYIDDEFEFIDRFEHLVSVAAKYRLFAHTLSSLRYGHGFIKYPDAEDFVGGTDRDGDYDQISVGLEGELLAKMIGNVSIGYESRDYNNDQDLSDIIFLVSVTEYFTPKTALSLSYQRAAKESVFIGNNFYFSNSVGLVLDQKLLWGVSGKFAVSYQNNEYDQSTVIDGVSDERNDDIFGISVGLLYPVRDWLTTGVEYGYANRDSNFEDFEYKDNRVVWRTTASF